MTESLQDKVAEFLPRFFGPGNELRWEMIESGELSETAKAYLNPWIGDLKISSRPVFLPRVHTGDRTDWYALAFKPDQARALPEIITAFIGPSYSDFSGQAAELDPADPIDRAVHEFVGNNAFKFTVAGSDNKTATNNALKILRNLWEQKPERRLTIARIKNRILRDFQMALAVGDYLAARERIEELRSGGHLSANNLLFLRVRVLAAEENWGTLLGLPELPDLMAIRRPALVTQSIIRAVYATELARFEAEKNPGAAVSHFREQLLSKYMPLFRARGSMSVPEVIKSFMIMAVASDPPRNRIARRILSDFPQESVDYPYLEALANLSAVGPETPEAPTIKQAQDAYNSNDFETAFHLLSGIRHTPESLRLLLLCGSEISSLESARETVRIVQECSENEQKTALGPKVIREIWEELLELCGSDRGLPTPETIPSNWTEWLEHLNRTGPSAADLRIVEQGAVEWKTEALVHDPDLIQRTAGLLLEERDQRSTETLHNAVPFIMGFFLPEGVPKPAFKPIYQSLFILLCLDNKIGADDLIALNDLAAGLLEIGVTKEEYSELLNGISEAWARVESPRYFDWALDSLDLLAAYPVLCRVSLTEYYCKVINSFSRWLRRVEGGHWALLRCLSEDLGQAEAFSGVHPDTEDAVGETEERETVFQDKTIAIYTLTESVGKRIRIVLERMLRNSRIEISSDRVGSVRLRNLARTADVFIVATRSAKHAATEFIKTHRPKSLPTLYPRGKGSASMLMALSEYLQQEVRG